MKWRLPVGIIIGFVLASACTVIAWYVIPVEVEFTVRQQCVELFSWAR